MAASLTTAPAGLRTRNIPAADRATLWVVQRRATSVRSHLDPSRRPDCRILRQHSNSLLRQGRDSCGTNGWISPCRIRTPLRWASLEQPSCTDLIRPRHFGPTGIRARRPQQSRSVATHVGSCFIPFHGDWRANVDPTPDGITPFFAFELIVGAARPAFANRDRAAPVGSNSRARPVDAFPRSRRPHARCIEHGGASSCRTSTDRAGFWRQRASAAPVSSRGSRPAGNRRVRRGASSWCRP